MTKLVLCSGKVYYDIAGHEERESAGHIAVARVELLYPFPEGELTRAHGELPEPGAGGLGPGGAPQHGRPRLHAPADGQASCPSELAYDYVGRQLRAAPGEGYAAAHKREQSRIVRVALDLEEDRLEPDSSAQRPLM